MAVTRCGTAMRLLTATLFVTIGVVARRGSYQILGMFVDSRTNVNREQLYSTCFSGLGFVSCEHQRTVEQGDGWMFNETPGLNALVGNYGSSPYCLDCCGNTNRDGGRIDDFWDLRCQIGPSQRVLANRVTNEFRFGRNFRPGDDKMVACPIIRSECIDSYFWYDGDESPRYKFDPDSSCTSTQLELQGYTLKLWVEEVSDGITYWRSVRRCEITPVEAAPSEIEYVSVTNSIFFEKIQMVNYGDGTRFYMPAFQIVLLTLAGLVVVAVIVQWFRNVNCPICSNRMIICVNKCFWCRLYNAQMPDEELLDQLRKRDEILRGKDPHRRDVCKRTVFFICLKIWNELGFSWLVGKTTRVFKSLFRCEQRIATSAHENQRGGMEGKKEYHTSNRLVRAIRSFCDHLSCTDAPVVPTENLSPSKPQIPREYSQFLPEFDAQKISVQPNNDA